MKSFKIDNQGGFSSYDNSKLALSPKKKFKEEEAKFSSVSSTVETLEPLDVSADKGFSSALNSWMNRAMDSTKYIAEKVGELDLGTKLISTSNVIAEKTSNLVDKAAEVAVRILYFNLHF